MLDAVRRDLRRRYRDEYCILAFTSARELLDSLAEIKAQDDTVALFMSDQRMPEMGGVDFLNEARRHFSDAKWVLLTAYAEPTPTPPSRRSKRFGSITISPSFGTRRSSHFTRGSPSPSGEGAGGG